MKLVMDEIRLLQGKSVVQRITLKILLEIFQIILCLFVII